MLLAQSPELGLFLWSEQLQLFQVPGLQQSAFSRRVAGLAGLASYDHGTGLQSGIRKLGGTCCPLQALVCTHVHTQMHEKAGKGGVLPAPSPQLNSLSLSSP